MWSIYHDHGIRFRYPAGWALEVSEDGPRTTVTVNEPGGTAFLLVTLDENRPAPSKLTDEALSAMRAEYPDLEALDATETIAGHKAIGHDLEFFTFDLLGSCVLRCFRTPRRTVLVMGQWSDSVDAQDTGSLLRAARKSMAETDA